MKYFKTIIPCIVATALSFSGLQAQTNTKSLLNNILNKVSEATSQNLDMDISGTWEYEGSACNFETSNILKQAGGALVANQVENKFDSYLAKIGIKEGAGSFIFNTDSTYSATLGKAKFSGNYTLDTDSKTVTLTYLKGIGKIKADVEKSSSSLQLLFDADNLLKMLKMINSAANNSTLKALTTLTDAYDGVQLGFELGKQ